jgi:hypothetical protein
MHLVPFAPPREPYLGRATVTMIGKNIFIWNVRGLNLRAHRAAVRDLLVA